MNASDSPSMAVGAGAEAGSRLIVFELNGTLGADGVSGLSLQQVATLPSPFIC